MSDLETAVRRACHWWDVDAPEGTPGVDAMAVEVLADLVEALRGEVPVPFGPGGVLIPSAWLEAS